MANSRSTVPQDGDEWTDYAIVRRYPMEFRPADHRRAIERHHVAGDLGAAQWVVSWLKICPIVTAGRSPVRPASQPDSRLEVLLKVRATVKDNDCNIVEAEIVKTADGRGDLVRREACWRTTGKSPSGAPRTSRSSRSTWPSTARRCRPLKCDKGAFRLSGGPVPRPRRKPRPTAASIRATRPRIAGCFPTARATRRQAAQETDRPEARLPSRQPRTIRGGLRLHANVEIRYEDAASPRRKAGSGGRDPAASRRPAPDIRREPSRSPPSL